ncbi:divergent protein kinase domain 2B isoform X3 [Heterodontus francisci]|uniref:divergent protein kinase domain 2B isoform X3 n=1 Tax=Heterodontus francisci TaxID=7792 RepID=UPI00355BB7A6
MWSCVILVLMSLAPLAVSLNTRAKTIANVTRLKPVYNFGRSFLGLDKCNACIGTSLCRKFFKEEIRFENWLSAGLKLPPSHRKTYFANYTADTENWKPVVISRLQSKYQNEVADRKICMSASKKVACSIENVLRGTERFQKWLTADRLTAELVQLFPGIEGWPFVRYFGSCGRVIVTPWTIPIREFYNASSEVTADIAYQLLQITHSLRNNDLNYFLYYTSVHDNMFGTFEDGRLYITDTSTIGIIDKKEDKEFVHEIHGENDVFSCLASDCKTELSPCGNVSEAQNFIKVCRDLLSHLLADKFSSSPSLQQKIDRFLSLCSDEMLSTKVTLEAASCLMELLRSQRSCDPRFEYRYPECKYIKGY